MGAGDEIWKLTTLGRNRAKSIYSDEARNPIIAFLYDTGGSRGEEKGIGTASVEEIALHNRQSTGTVSASLKKLRRRGLVERVGVG